MKKTVFLCLLLALLLPATGCTKDKRFGIAELSRRLEAYEEDYKFSPADALLSDGYFHISYAMESDEDMLLSLREDADGKLTRILLTASEDNAPTEDFCEMATALTSVFCGVSEHGARALLEEAGLTDKNSLFGDKKGTAVRGRYACTFFSTPLSVTVLLEYDDAILQEIPSTE